MDDKLVDTPIRAKSSAKAFTDISIKATQPRDKQFKVFDLKETGLYLLILPSGTKTFYFKYWIKSKSHAICIGKYPYITLAEARDKAYNWRKQVEQGIDPGAPIAAPAAIVTFRQAAELLVENKRKAGAAGGTLRKFKQCLENDLYPKLSGVNIELVNEDLVVPILEKIAERSYSLAVKNLELVTMIVRHAINKRIRKDRLGLDLSAVLKEPKREEKIAPASDPELFRKIVEYIPSVMQSAMKLQYICFLRSTETMGARWSEINFEKKQWLVPGYRHINPETGEKYGGMKMKRQHIVPLSTHAVEIFRDLQKKTGEHEYIFPSLHTNRGMCGDALSKAFRSINMGIIPHDCRSLAGSWLKLNGFPPYLIEKQLAHSVGKTEKAYERTAHLFFLDERTQMMQAWSDYLHSEHEEDALNDNNKVTSLSLLPNPS